MKKILIWGYGIEGKATLNYYLTQDNVEIYVATKDKLEDEIINNFKEVHFILENEIFDYNFDIAVKSSGVSFYKEEVEKLINKGTLITSNLNILLENNKNIKYIGITGTKGKSTTSSMLYHILSNLGFKTALVGNIGKSFLDIINEKYDYAVLELSSCQLKNFYETLDYGIILNLFKEHIDWHKSHDNYFKDKMLITEHSKKLIYNANDDTIKKYINIKNNFIEFGNKKNFHVENNAIYFNNEKIIDITDYDNIHGEHIFRNICSLLTFLKEENIDINKALESLKTFETLQHRLEIFYHNKETNTIFINDSISTIPEATIEALKTFNDKDVFLILGGYDRQQDYTDLVKTIENSKNIKKIFLLGTTGQRLQKLLTCDNVYFDNLKDLTDAIKKENLNNKIVLLSPASASYDMFKNFEERGKIFKEYMLK